MLILSELTVASYISVILSGDFKVAHTKQVFHFNCVRINEVSLYIIVHSFSEFLTYLNSYYVEHETC